MLSESQRVRQAPGGGSSLLVGVSDGSDANKVMVSLSNNFADGTNQNGGHALSERPSTRLHQAPGGNSTLLLGVCDDSESQNEAVVVSSNKFANGSNQNCGNVLSERPSTRLHQAPGGNSTLLLGVCDDSECQNEAVVVSSNKFANGSNQNCGNVLSERPSTRLLQAPGGNSTLLLGSREGDDIWCQDEVVSSNKFADGANQNCGNALSERPSTRLHQAPGGNSTLLLGVCEDSSSQHAAATVSSNKFANGANQNSGNVISDRPSTRVRQAPGGHTTLCLSYDETPTKSDSKKALEIFEESSSMKAAGGDALTMAGKSTLCLGTTNIPCSSPAISHRQAPGGASTLCLGYSPEAHETPMKLQPPGGNASICLGVHDDEVVVEVHPSGRHPPGGDATLHLGETAAFDEEPSGRPVTAPGGETTICLGLPEHVENSEPQTNTRPVGGAATICLGLPDDEASPAHSPTEPGAIRHIGGPTTICLGLLKEQEEEPMEPSNRVAPGGETTICLGVMELPPRERNDTRPPPGGNTTICLDGPTEGEALPSVMSVSTRPIGGATTICLGVLNEPEGRCEELSDRVAPGGATTICLGLKDLSPRQRNETRPPPGGDTTICLGVENDENCNVANVLNVAPYGTV